MNTASTPLLELVWLNRRFGTLLNGGTPLAAALAALEPDASPAFRAMLADVIAQIRGGATLYAALTGHAPLIPPIYREWVRIGEETGTLDVGALEVAELLHPLALGGGDAVLGWDQVENAVSLIQFTRRCAELLEKGLEWWRVLVLLTHEAPPNFAALIGLLMPKRDESHGWLALWQRMEDYPQTFSPFYRALVRQGFKSHAMDESMRGLADLLYEDWRLSRLTRAFDDRPSLIIDAAAPPAAAWSDLTPVQRKLTLTLFCRAAAHLLALGLDTEEAMSLCALLLPVAECTALQTAAHDGLDDLPAALRQLAILPPFAHTLLTRGHARARLDYACNQAAQVLGQELVDVENAE